MFHMPILSPPQTALLPRRSRKSYRREALINDTCSNDWAMGKLRQDYPGILYRLSSPAEQSGFLSRYAKITVIHHQQRH
ncbi:MAG: hypothetical protein RR051_05770, partial [Clostridiales bacterium]